MSYKPAPLPQLEEDRAGGLSHARAGEWDSRGGYCALTVLREQTKSYTHHNNLSATGVTTRYCCHSKVSHQLYPTKNMTLTWNFLWAQWDHGSCISVESLWK